MSFKIIGTGMYVPSRAVTNDDLAQIVETNDEWITKRVGIKERRISETEFTSDLGMKAAQAALDDCGCTAKPRQDDEPVAVPGYPSCCVSTACQGAPLSSGCPEKPPLP